MGCGSRVSTATAMTGNAWGGAGEGGAGPVRGGAGEGRGRMGGEENSTVLKCRL